MLHIHSNTSAKDLRRLPFDENVEELVAHLLDLGGGLASFAAAASLFLLARAGGVVAVFVFLNGCPLPTAIRSAFALSAAASSAFLLLFSCLFRL